VPAFFVLEIQWLFIRLRHLAAAFGLLRLERRKHFFSGNWFHGLAAKCRNPSNSQERQMSSTKQKIKQELSARKIAKCSQAIEKIPGPHGRTSPSKSFAIFLQHALAATVEANRQIGEPLFLTEAQFRKLGFTPIDPDADLPGKVEIERAIAAYLEAVRDNEPFTDILTPVHANFIGKGGDGLGQYFTPWDLAKLCAALSADHKKRHGQAQDPHRISDPCCGAGGLLLAAIQEDLAGNRSIMDKAQAAFAIHVHANDIDPMCAAMTALQLAANQFLHMLALGEVRIEVGDTLTGKTECVFKTKNRFALARGVAAIGTRASLPELQILDHMAGNGGNKQARPLETRILTNPPFGKGAMAAWDRTRGELLKRGILCGNGDAADEAA
jgi:hypothetical protein